MSSRILHGKIISTKMQDTVTVDVETIEKHKVYGKTYRRNKKYKAHYTGGKLKEGDIVSIKESKPYSRTKSWIVIEENDREES